MDSKEFCIGIDLGTTNSCVGLFINNRVEIIANDQGNRLTPSIVAFTNSGRLIGDPAKNQISRNPENTIFNSKRFLGCKFTDPSVQSELSLCPFKVQPDNNSKPQFTVNLNGEEKKFYPEEITAMILQKLKEIAEDYLGTSVNSAVVSVPANFNDVQRQATRDAGIISGLQIKRLINEPTLAAMAYGLHNKSQEDLNVVIFDLGGGTLDISVLAILEGISEVRATFGNSHLGGTDFDNRMIHFCIEDLKKRFEVDVKGNKRAVIRLRVACERAKKNLSSSSQASIELENLVDGVDYFYTFTRAKFEELNMDYFIEFVNSINKVLCDALISKHQVHEVVLIGGSSRIPKVQQMIQELFNGKELCKSINPDEAVAYGASLQGGILSGDESSLLEKLLLVDVVPFSLGIETAGGVNSIIFPKNTCIPTKKSQIFTTFLDNQPCVHIKLFECEGQKTEHCNLLGEFKLEGIPLEPKGVPKIEVTFDVDANCIMNLSAVIEGTGKGVEITINNGEGRLGKLKLEELKEEADKYKRFDEGVRKRDRVKNGLESYFYNLKNSINCENFNERFETDERSFVKAKIEEISEWIESNSDTTFEQFQEKQSELERIFNPIMQRLCGSL